MNGVSVCLEEIALEGLDGITISTLWRRMDSATLCSTVDESYKEFLWGCISSCQDIEAYLLEKERKEIVDFTNVSKIYPYHCINEAGVRGSCANFKSRSLIDVSNISLKTVVEKYGNRLALVASQLLRNKVLLGPEFDVTINIPENSYCMLEIIGRARRLGCLHSNLGLQTMIDSRSLFSHVKTLLKLQLITKQTVLDATRGNSPTSIIYLARYHTEHVYDSTQFKICQTLSKSQDSCMSLDSLCSDSSLGDVKEIIEVVEELSNSGHVQYLSNSEVALQNTTGTISQSTHEADHSERLYNMSQEVLERKDNKVVKLVQHFYNLYTESDNEFEDEEWAQPERQELSMCIPAELPIMHAIYNFIASRGTKGASLSQCCQELSFPFFSMRKILKNMEVLQVLFCKYQDVGNTKQNMYIARNSFSQIQESQNFGSAALPDNYVLPVDITQAAKVQSRKEILPSTDVTIQTQTILNNQSSNAVVAHTPCPVAQTADIQPLQFASESTTQLPVCQALNPTAATIVARPSPRPLNPPSTTQTANLSAIRTSTLQQSSSIVDPPTSVRSRFEKNNDSEKFIRRKEIILNILKDFKVVESQSLFLRIIRMKEKKMGLNITVDRRSVSFILNRLTADGVLKRIEVNVKVEEQEHQVELFCDLSIPTDDEKLAACIQEFKDRIAIQNAKRTGILDGDKQSPTSVPLPKMPRVEILHMFLFYVIYELSNPNIDLEAWRLKYDWAKHLKPEHAPNDIGKGWFTPFSILQLLPVSLYLKLVDTYFHNHVIKQYSNNPETKHMLLKDLPPLARQILFDARKSHFLFESFEFLVHFGLITPTNKQIFFNERDIVCYLHTSTVVKDTRDSEPSYDEVKHPEEGEFPGIQFTFNAMDDVEEYWDTVRKICLSTPLNKKMPRNNKKVKLVTTFESLVVDKQEVAACNKPRGDGLGAAGFDSRLYTHLTRKWKWPLLDKRADTLDSDVEDALDWQMCFTNDERLGQKMAAATSVGKKKTKRKRTKSVEVESITKKKRKLGDEEKTDTSQVASTSTSAQQNTLNDQPKDSRNVEKSIEKGKKKQKKRKRKKKKVQSIGDPSKVKPNKAKGSHEHWTKRIHDKRDEEALKQSNAKRNSFTPQQQKLLFICCLALRIIGKKSVDTGYSDWLWTRDILYKDNYETAKTKTALSICRKYRSMMKNTQTKTNLDICVADCLQEKEFQPYCNLGKKCNEAMFNELVELLKKKYSMENMVSNCLVLPSTMQEFQQQINLYNSLEVENSEKCDEDILSLEPRETSVSDIRQRVIRDSIISALLLGSVSYQSHVAFRFLSQFTEEELIIAISVLKNGRIVVRKQLRYTKSGFDLASCAFSQMLSTHGQRIIESHFPFSLLDEAQSYYDEITSSSKTLQHSQSSEQFQPLKVSESSLHGGKVFCIFALLTCQRLGVKMEVPDNILVLAKNPSSKKPKLNTDDLNEGATDDGGNVTSKEACEILEPEIRGNKKVNSCKNIKASQKSTISNVEIPENSNVTRALNHEECQSSSQTTINVQDEDEEDVVVIPGNINRKRSNDMILDVLCGIEDHLFGHVDLESNTSLHKVNLKPTSSFTCSMTTSNIDSVRACGKKHDVLRNVDKSSLRDKNVHERYLEKLTTYKQTGDLNRIHFSIKPCNIQVRSLPVAQMTSTRKEESLAQSVANHFKTKGLRMPETIEECIAVCSKMFGYSKSDCEALKTVFETINSTEELGMTTSSVSKVVRSQYSDVSFSTDGLIKVLEAFNLVYQVGFVEACYVTKAFKKNWFLNTCEVDVGTSSKTTDLEKEFVVSEKQKRSISEEEKSANCERSGIGEERKTSENGQPKDVMTSDNTTSSNIDERTLSSRTRSKTASSSKSQKTSNENENSVKQTVSHSSKPCRPWITMTGEMNKNAYNTLHRSVLAYIIKYPGVQKFSITKHFVNLVYPVAIEDILERLRKFGCIEQRVCYIKKTTLFSSKPKSKSTYYLPKPDAMFKMMKNILL